MFMQLDFSKVHIACHNIVNGIKPGSVSKKTDKHAADLQKLYVGRKSDIYEMYKNVHTSMRPKICVSLIKKHFLFIQEKFHASKISP